MESIKISDSDVAALQFSGGKDSIALLWLCRDILDRLTVYFLDTGDVNPETLEVVEWAKSVAPNFVTIHGDVRRVHGSFGYPSDVLPYSSTDSAAALGQLVQPMLQDRYNCCWRSIMAPLHSRMIADGVTVILRGQKDADEHKGPFRSGHADRRITYIYPLQEWSDVQVLEFIKNTGAPIPSFYQGGYSHVGDCLHCTAWLGGGRGKYLKEKYPVAFQTYRQRLTRINEAIMPSVANLMNDLEV